MKKLLRSYPEEKGKNMNYSQNVAKRLYTDYMYGSNKGENIGGNQGGSGSGEGQEKHHWVNEPARAKKLFFGKTRKVAGGLSSLFSM